MQLYINKITLSLSDLSKIRQRVEDEASRTAKGGEQQRIKPKRPSFYLRQSINGIIHFQSGFTCDAINVNCSMTSSAY